MKRIYWVTLTDYSSDGWQMTEAEFRFTSRLRLVFFRLTAFLCFPAPATSAFRVIRVIRVRGE